jgi:hypothetical protein
MKTIDELWQEYRKLAAPLGVPEREVEQHRKSFYAGAAAMFFAVTELGDDAISEADAKKQLVHFNREIAEHIAAVLAERQAKGDNHAKH